MKVALIGAGGNAGSRILVELVRRGHDVLALARTPSKVTLTPAVQVKKLDASDACDVAGSVCGRDAVLSATRFTQTHTQNLIDGITASGVKRFVVVGGAGSLIAPSGRLEMDDPGFPTAVKPEAQAGARFLDQLRKSELDWTFLCPSRFFLPGERTGIFRLGTDHLLVDQAGRSAISLEDYAMALVDELETPGHLRARFTVGY
jgi:uncharacterized protein